jgi:hypothetical protein
MRFLLGCDGQYGFTLRAIDVSPQTSYDGFVVDEVMRQVRVLEELVKARLEVDMPGIVAGVRARLESRLQLKAIPVDKDLADKEGPIGWGRVHTTVWEAPGFRKISLTQVSMRPMIEGLAVVLLPSPKAIAPIFACDLMALPTRVSVNADLYGNDRPALRAVLEPLGESFVRLGTGGGPSWAQPISSGVGLHAKVSLRAVDDAYAALTAALARTLDVVVNAPPAAGNGVAQSDVQRQFFQLFHQHGPRTGALGRIFGASWAERYSRLIFE